MKLKQASLENLQIGYKKYLQDNKQEKKHNQKAHDCALNCVYESIEYLDCYSKSDNVFLCEIIDKAIQHFLYNEITKYFDDTDSIGMVYAYIKAVSNEIYANALNLGYVFYDSTYDEIMIF